MGTAPIRAFRNLARKNPFGGMTGRYEVLSAGEGTTDDAGGWTPGEETVKATYPGNFRTLTAEEKADPVQVREQLDGIISFPHDAEVSSGDALRDARTGTRYEIKGVDHGEPELTVVKSVRVGRA